MEYLIFADKLTSTSESQFQQIDVFSSEPVKGNPVAMAIGEDALTTEQMVAFANWMNLTV
ncbi:PhzF family phenazine biosynthesis protein [Acetobacter estunensis]|uniref:PhzF family phenazine biosynthesis protein n=1 Tax=Acetobacter estunensis TaxID=104097 RepID=UPI002795EA35|nr:PhzF family phenazine biosynthesis protein [Acetobacter estunensis]